MHNNVMLAHKILDAHELIYLCSTLLLHRLLYSVLFQPTTSLSPACEYQVSSAFHQLLFTQTMEWNPCHNSSLCYSSYRTFKCRLKAHLLSQLATQLTQSVSVHLATSHASDTRFPCHCPFIVIIGVKLFSLCYKDTCQLLQGPVSFDRMCSIVGWPGRDSGVPSGVEVGRILLAR